MDSFVVLLDAFKSTSGNASALDYRLFADKVHWMVVEVTGPRSYSPWPHRTRHKVEEKGLEPLPPFGVPIFKTGAVPIMLTLLKDY